MEGLPQIQKGTTMLDRHFFFRTLKMFEFAEELRGLIKPEEKFLLQKHQETTLPALIKQRNSPVVSAFTLKTFK